jgi:hypothetical protein
MRKISWLVLIAITLLGIYFAYETDANYLEFIKATDKVQLIVHEGDLRLSKDSAVISFTVEIVNSSPASMWVEAINYHLSINGQYGGYDYMEEARQGEIAIAPGEGRRIPLQTKLRADYLKLLLEARGKGQEVLVSIDGRARTGFEIGRSGLKAFYPIGGVIWKESQ